MSWEDVAVTGLLLATIVTCAFMWKGCEHEMSTRIADCLRAGHKPIDCKELRP